ncbi:MAG: ROK family protein [Clostridia bacterium]|nr:ROK family protein [Clostridia bacterium]
MGFLTRHHTEIYGKREVPVDFDGYRTPIMETVLQAACDMLKECPEEPEGIAVSATGQIDDKTGTVIGTNGKIPHYEGVCIGGMLEERFHLRCMVINDANAAALGECAKGRAKGLKDVIMVTLGTGVGGGIVIGGRLYQGRRGIAGELGHFTLYQDGPKCTCGKRGCYESYASATALVRAAERETGEHGLSGREIFRRVQAGDGVLQKVLNLYLDDVAAGITGLVHIFSPEMVVIGGGISQQEKLLMAPLRRKVLDGCMPRFREGLQIERAVLGNDAGMIGAGEYFWQTH